LNCCVERSEDILVETAKGADDIRDSLRRRGDYVPFFDNMVKGRTARNDIDLNTEGTTPPKVAMGIKLIVN
jgi:hypothetical protein